MSDDSNDTKPTPPAHPVTPRVIVPPYEPAPAEPADVSPTGEALIPPVAAKWMAPIALIAGLIVLEGPEIGLMLPAAVLPWVKFVYLLGSVFGIVSPGARRKVP